MEKSCKKCGETKDIGEFYSHPRGKDGKKSECKECTKAAAKMYRDKNIEKWREYDRARGNRQPKGYCNEWRNTNPIKYAAQTMIGNRLRDGKIEKPDLCEECGSQNQALHGHHDDYAKPLEVRWLCPSCHRNWHVKNGEGANAH